MGDIRPAVPEDAEELARLQAEYHAERYGPDHLAGYRTNFGRFAHEALSAGWTAWVVEGQAGLEGAVWCHHDLNRPDHDRDWAGVTRLYVDPLAGDDDLAGRLVDHVVRWAREAGFRSVAAWPSDEQGFVFLEAGFEPAPHGAFTLSLTPDGPSALASSAVASSGEAVATPADHQFSARAADEAGRLLLRLRDERGFADADRLRAEGDRRSHDLLVGLLAETYPDDAVLSEEGSESDASIERRLTSRRVWIVDPLDGTREFGEEGRTDWGVHVALCIDGIPVAGAVALPARGMTLSTARVDRAPSRPDRLRLLISRTRRPEPLVELAERLGAEVVEMGSAGAKAMAVVLGEAEIYAHTGGQYEWDSAAPVAVAAAAGLHVSRLDGSPLVYNQPRPHLPDLLICRADVAAEVMMLAPGGLSR